MQRLQDVVQGYDSVCVIGLGTVGGPTAEFFLERGNTTYGCDLKPSALERLAPRLAGAAADLSALPLADVYVVTVDTTLRGGAPYVDNVFRACEAIAARGQPKFVSIESTVPLGTCRRIHETVFRGNQRLVHVPHRWWADDTRNHGVRQARVIGGVDEASLEAAMPFYRRAGIPLLPVADIRIAELCKAAENTDRYLKIAYAEFLRLACDEQGLDFEELRQAMNSKWNVEILEARDGIGGTCLPKDIVYLETAAPGRNDLLEGARSVDRQYRESREKGP